MGLHMHTEMNDLVPRNTYFQLSQGQFFSIFLESCNPMVVLAIVCVVPAHIAATMQWARLWGHVGAHNDF